MKMKVGYAISLGTLVVILVLVEIVIFCSRLGEHPRLENAIQSAGIFVALLAAIIGLSGADPKRGRIKVTCPTDGGRGNR